MILIGIVVQGEKRSVIIFSSITCAKTKPPALSDRVHDPIAALGDWHAIFYPKRQTLNREVYLSHRGMNCSTKQHPQE